MELRQYCGTEARRQNVAASRKDMGNGLELNGIDYLEVLDADAPSEEMRQRIIDLTFLKSDGVTDSGNPVLTAENIGIEGGSRITDIQIEKEVETGEDPKTLRLTLDRFGDYSRYTLRLRANPATDAPPHNMDPVLSSMAFSFKVDCHNDFDCKPAAGGDVSPQPGPALDYLAKDYESFRRLMLDRMAATMPDWSERSPADLGVTLVEALAYAADYASYYQDAVATEAYLPLARLRTSVRRHARLLGYRVSEGCNARTFIVVKAKQDSAPADRPAIRKGTRTLTGALGLGESFDPALRPDPVVLQQLRNAGAVIFETMEDVKAIYTARNSIPFHTWGESNCCLLKGATSAHLVDQRNPQGDSERRLAAGNVLIFEELIPVGRTAQDPADPSHRQAVRLVSDPVQLEDPLDDTKVLEIHWHQEDALRFPLNLQGDGASPGAVAHGNVVLADHGLTLRYGKTWVVLPDEDPSNPWAEDAPELKEQSGLVPEPLSKEAGQTGLIPPKDEAYRPLLSVADITHAAPFDPKQARQQAALAALRTDVNNTQPMVYLVGLSGTGELWSPQSDLLASDRFAPEFVVETESDRTAKVRFGDGQFGKRPGTDGQFTARVRTGNGLAGNIGSDAIKHIITADPDVIETVRNPLPAIGGTPPESLNTVKINAPRAFRTQRRAVTANDYTRFAQTHPDVQKAVTERRWTGSWHTMFIAVDRFGGRKVDQAFEAELRDHIGRYRLAGHDIEIEGMLDVPLDIALLVCVDGGYYASDVEKRLLSMFGPKQLSDGTLGYFHPDNFSFSAPVKLSAIIARAMKVAGVKWIGLYSSDNVLRGHFRKLHDQSVDYGEEGIIPIGRREVARLDNDPNAPENGRLSFLLEGGQ